MSLEGITADEVERIHVHRAVQRWCAYVAAPMVVLLGTGLVLAQFFPAIRPSDTALQVAHQYARHNDRIKVGLILQINGIFCFFFFCAVVTDLMRRVRNCPASLRYVQVGALGSMSMIFLLPTFCWLTAAYRVDGAEGRTADGIALLNDLGWMTFIFGYFAFSIFMIAVGIGILLDGDDDPVYPRWLAYLNFFTALSFVPDEVIPFFKTGPFAWNGLFPFYLPFATYGAWIGCTAWCTVRRLRWDQEAEEEWAAAPGPEAQATAAVVY